jgi:hypothetical protein
MTKPLFQLPEAEQAALRTVAQANVPAGLPEFVKKRLIASGLMDEATGATRRARARRCEQCRQPVMRGIDADWAGSVVDCDPTPVSALGEVMALVDGRRTYELRYLGDRYEIDLRTPERIRGNPVGTSGLDVLVAHSHDGSSREYAHIDTALNDKPITPAHLLSDKPPF